MAAVKSKKGRDLVVGDTVLTEEGDAVRLTSVARGMIENCVLVEWRDGWAHIGNRDKVEVQ